MPSPPPSMTLPIGQRYLDAPEGEIRDEAQLPLRMKLANKILDIMGMPEPGGPPERYIAPGLGMALMAEGAGRSLAAGGSALASKVGESGIVKAARRAWNPTNPGSLEIRPQPSPHPIVENIARRFVNPEDEKLYQLFLQASSRENAALEGKLPKASTPSLEEPRSVYGNALSDVAFTREQLRDAQAQARWHNKNRSFPIAESEQVPMTTEPPSHSHPGFLVGDPAFKGWRPRDSPQLTLVDHGLQAMKDYHKGTPLSSLALRTLAYNAAKGAVHGTEKVAPSYAPKVEDWLLRRAGSVTDLGMSPGTLTQATPPSMKSIMWGLRPFWARD